MYKSQIVSDEGKRRARGGTRTVFQAMKTLGTCENMRNPGQSQGCLAQYETKSVDIVHTPFGGAGGLPGHQMPGNLGGRVQQIDSARGDSDDEVEAFIRGEAMPVTVDPQQQHHERPRRPFVAVNGSTTFVKGSKDANPCLARRLINPVTD